MVRFDKFPRYALLFMLAASPTVVRAVEVRVANREELVQALDKAQAGTTILIAPGTYRGGLTCRNLRGTKAAPIVIAGADAMKPPLLEGGGSGLHLRSPEHVMLRDLEIASATGNGLNIDDAGSTDTPAHHLLLKNIVVRDIGPEGNRDGIKLSGVNDFRIEGCRIQRWGGGGSGIDMVGCHRGDLTGCQFLDARGQSANGVQAKGGSRDIQIQHCRFQKAGGRGVNAGGSTGLAYFRPIDASYEAAAITVEDCEFIEGMSAVAFVGVDGAVVQHNTIYRPGRWPLRILQENTEPRFVASRHGRFRNNIVVFRADEVRETVNVGPHTLPDSFSFSGNLWHCLDRPADTRRLVRLPSAETGGAYGRDPGFSDAAGGDLRIPGRKPADPGVRPRAD